MVSHNVGDANFPLLNDFLQTYTKFICASYLAYSGPVVRNPQPHIEYYIKHRQDRENEIVHLLNHSDHSSNSIVQVSLAEPQELSSLTTRVILPLILIFVISRSSTKTTLKTYTLLLLK